MLDPRKRLQTEIKSCNLLEDYHLTPKVIEYDTDLNIALFEWIDGKTLHCVENEHIDQALNFVETLEELNSPDLFQAASEACTSAEQLFSQIEDRLKQLEALEDEHLKLLLNNVFKTLNRKTKTK